MNVPIYEMTWSTELGLTIRELDVLACLTEHQSSKRIAKILNISPRTAETHIFNVMQKLGKNTRTAVIDLIKNSDCSGDLRQHFSRLDEEFLCQTYLEAIKKEVALPRQNCCLLSSDPVLKHKIEMALTGLNIFCLNKPKKEVKTIYVKFQDNYPYTLFLILENILGEISTINQALNFFKKGTRKEFLSPLKSRTVSKTSLLIFCLLFLAGSACFYHIKFSSPAQIIRSDFCIPLESQMLQRHFVLDQIRRGFKNKNKIQCVALVGIGGAGKTTLARQYAKQQNCSLVWEINSENRTVLLDAFSHLSYNLSKTAEEKHEIEYLRKNNDDKAYEKKIIQITKQKLKKLKCWFLVFDNVESLEIVKPFLPFDEKTCGTGKILLTTRNNNIADNVYIQKSDAIFIPPLSEKEKEELFLKLQDTSCQNKNQVLDFLKTLPPFPLDIVLASSYLKNTCGFSDQFQKLYNSEKQNKIRFHLIDQVVQKLIEKYPASVPILLFITQIGSQDIHKELLWQFKAGRPYLNEIITEMARQSLINVSSI